MKKIIAIMAAALSLATFTGTGYADEKLQSVLRASPQINGNCSGQVIWSQRDQKSGNVKTVILTAKHCVADSSLNEQTVDFPVYANNRIVKKNQYFGKVMGVSYRSDLALIELKDKQTLFEDIMKIGPDPLNAEIGDKVYVIGYPLGQTLTITEGLLAAYQTIDKFNPGHEYLRATPDLAPGNSGGSLVRQTKDGSYELLGVTTAQFNGVWFMNLFTGTTEVREYLKTALPESIGLPPVTNYQYTPYNYGAR